MAARMAGSKLETHSDSPKCDAFARMFAKLANQDAKLTGFAIRIHRTNVDCHAEFVQIQPAILLVLLCTSHSNVQSRRRERHCPWHLTARRITCTTPQCQLRGIRSEEMVSFAFLVSSSEACSVAHRWPDEGGTKHLLFPFLAVLV